MNTEFRVVWPDGVVFFDERGPPKRMVGANKDMTDRKNVENAVAEISRFVPGSREEMDRAIIAGDYYKLDRVLMILIRNALKFTELATGIWDFTCPIPASEYPPIDDPLSSNDSFRAT